MFSPYQQFMPQQQIIRVNGEQDCRNYQMLPGSSTLMLDSTAPRVFLVQTDAACNKTISAYKLEPYVEEKQPTLTDLSDRIAKIEEIINAKSNTSNVKRKQSEQSE